MIAKVLSLWQPWASLVAYGEKCWETRSWRTNYRGPLLIHAALSRKGWGTSSYSVKQQLSIARYGDPRKPRPGEYPHGAIVARVELVDVVEIDQALIRATPLPERILGDWRPGRFAWKLEHPVMFNTALPCRGRQGLFDLEISEA